MSEQLNASQLPTFTGTEVGYYFICKRKLWWFHHGVQVEHENERVQIGKIVQLKAEPKRPNFFISPVFQFQNSSIKSLSENSGD